jgi:hypothetical protein
VTFQVGTITRCAGQNHYQVPLTIGGQQFVLHTTKQEVEAAGPANWQDPAAKDAVLARLKSAILESGAVTFAQIRTALEGNTYKI